MSAGSSTDKGLSFTISGAQAGRYYPLRSLQLRGCVLEEAGIRRHRQGAEGKGRLSFFPRAEGDLRDGRIPRHNDNKKLDTNWIGIPSEGTCTSNNAKGRFGPPKWKDALFAYRGGQLAQR
jgi:hypothetical protein